jgi:hypothetical protein
LRSKTALNRYLLDLPFSAKGAPFISKSATGRIRRGESGAAPQDYGKFERIQPRDCGAIQFAQQFESTRQLNRAFSARFRGDLNSWGGAPGWFEIAPAALNTLAA